MPSGIAVKYLHCKKCEGSQFKTISDLRKHQWAEHKETFANLTKAVRRPHKHLRCSQCGLKFKGQSALQQHHWAEHKGKPEPAVPSLRLARNGDMRVSELLDELQGQQKFINDVVALIGGILSRHQEAKQ